MRPQTQTYYKNTFKGLPVTGLFNYKTVSDIKADNISQSDFTSLFKSMDFDGMNEEYATF